MADKKEEETKPYEVTGVSARDQVRKMLFEAFTAEGDHSETECAAAVEGVESAI